ncbi:MAG: MFS transporter, partial [Candidatus Nanopelagicales bacterium]
MERTITLQKKFLRILASAQVLLGVGTASTVAAGSLLMSKVSGSESLAGLAQTFSVIGAAVLALPLARMTMKRGRRQALTFGYSSGVIGALLAVAGGVLQFWPIILLGTLFVGGAAAAGYQARFAATDLADDSRKAQDLSFVVWGSTIGAVAGPNLMQPMSKVAAYLGIEPLVGPYLLASCMFLLSAVMVWSLLRPDPYLLAQECAVASPTSVTLLETWKLLQKNARAMFAIASIAIGHVAMVSVMVMTPVHMA